MSSNTTEPASITRSGSSSTHIKLNPSATHYKIIADVEQIKKCAHLFLAGDLTADEKTGHNDTMKLVCLFARMKYIEKHTEHSGTASSGGLRFTKQNLRLPRVEVTSPNEDDFVRLLQSFEVPIGTWTFEDAKTQEQHPIPDIAVVPYLTLNTKSTLQGFLLFQQQVTQYLVNPHSSSPGGSSNSSSSSLSRALEPKRLLSQFKSCIHKADAPGKPVYQDLDVDTKNPEFIQLFKQQVFNEIRSSARQCVVAIIETNGGYHIVLNHSLLSKPHRSLLYEFTRGAHNIYKEPDRNGKLVTKRYLSLMHKPATGDNKTRTTDDDDDNEQCESMIPIPGTFQGLFVVRFVDIDTF